MLHGFFYVESILVEQTKQDFIGCIGSENVSRILRNDYYLFISMDTFSSRVTIAILNNIGEIVDIYKEKVTNPKLNFLETLSHSNRFNRMDILGCGTTFGDRYYLGCEKVVMKYESGDGFFYDFKINPDFGIFMADAEDDECETSTANEFIGVLSENVEFTRLDSKEVVIKESNNKTKIVESKGEKEMGVIKGFEFGVVGGDRVRLSHLGVAVKNKLGEFVAYDKAKGELINVDLIDLGIDNMIYKMPVAIKEIVVGDVIFHGNVPMVIKKVREDKKLVAIDPYDAEEKVIIPIKNMFGFDFATKVVSMIDFSNLGANEKTPFGNMLPLLLMSKGDGKGMSDMLPLMMMSQGGGAFDMSNPMMMMMMLGDKKGSMSDMLPLMMMSGMNPFGAKPVEKPTE